MSYLRFALALALFSALLGAQHAPGPSTPNAQKSYEQGMKYLEQQNTLAALDEFRKADQLEGGRCPACQDQIIKYGVQLREWKAAEAAAQEQIAAAKGAKDMALAHHQLATILSEEGVARQSRDAFERAHKELTKAIALDNAPTAVFDDGRVLAHLNRDAEAKAQFQRCVQMVPKMVPGIDPDITLAFMYLNNLELARAREAPAFAVTTLDGRRVSINDLVSKVALINFWATGCSSCLGAIPRLQQVWQEFRGQPLVILSVSLDSDRNKWKQFVTQHGMTWLNYCDGGGNGPMAKLFEVEAIPRTFTIDADGWLQDQHIGDTALEGKLKTLLARTRGLQEHLTKR